MRKFVVSACLAGHACRYDGGSNPHPAIIKLVRAGRACPVCPEALSGLPVPRPPCEQTGGRVVDREGQDVTDAFHRGAQCAVRIARNHSCTAGILKARSPSCGVGEIYDGSFTGVLVPGDGIWAALLKKAGLELYTEDSVPQEITE